MEMLNFFLIWIVLGLFCVVQLYLKFKFRSEKMEEIIADTCWTTGIDRQTIITIAYMVALLLGIILIPLSIVAIIYEWITGKELI